MRNKSLIGFLFGLNNWNFKSCATLAANILPEHKYKSNWPDLDLKYLCSPENTDIIRRSIKNRNGNGNIEKVIHLYNNLSSSKSIEERISIEYELIKEAIKIPNKAHPSVEALKNEPKVIKTAPDLHKWTFKPLKHEILIKKLNLMKTERLTNLTGPRSYFFFGGLAELEEALVRYSLNYLLQNKFQIMSVPDLLPRLAIEYCGMDTRSERTQVYSLDKIYGEDICLSGTAEMAIAYFLKGKKLEKSTLPLRIAAVSRCFRAETSKISVEKGIYRVHQFTKVEMFGVTSADNSAALLEEFYCLQESLFSSLGLQLRILDMPECELGAQAYRKYDIECYMPGKQHWGEISSTSDCTDYQSRRLNIKCTDGTFPHTINGTACAVPRLVIAILETNQNEDGTIKIPNVLIPFLGYEKFRKSGLPNIVYIRTK